MKNATKNNRNDFNFKETFNEFLENIQTKRDSEKCRNVSEVKKGDTICLIS